MKRTTKKTFKWYLSGKAQNLKKRIEQIRIEFLKMIEDAKQNY